MTVVARNRRRRASDATVCRLNVFIDPDAYERLMVHAVKAKLMPGLFVEKLILDHCKDWRVQDNTAAKSRRAVDPADPAASSVSAPLATEVKPNETAAG
jgi:hypothetical protein